MSDANRNQSELLFEEYLTTHGYMEWSYEVPIEGKSKNPDYRLEFGGSSYFFEVKEFETQPPMLEVGTYDPYGPIREKINKVAKQFKEYKEFSCSAVLANPNQAFVRLDASWAVAGAMFGDVGFRVQVGEPIGPDNPTQNVFTSGGKMVNDKRREPQNTTISSVIVLAGYPLRMNQIRIAIKQRELEVGRNLTVEESLEFYEAIPEAPELRRVRVIVYENPFARIPLSRDLFRGPYDQRFGVRDGYMSRIFVGEEIEKIEVQLGAD